jgi:hypothetical protein
LIRPAPEQDPIGTALFRASCRHLQARAERAGIAEKHGISRIKFCSTVMRPQLRRNGAVNMLSKPDADPIKSDYLLV